MTPSHANAAASRLPQDAHTSHGFAPQNLEAEESLLGAMLMAGADGFEQSHHVADALAVLGLCETDFLRESHRLIYRAALALLAEQRPSEAVLVADELERRGELEKVGGLARIAELAALVPATSNAPHWAEVVIEKARQREVLARLEPIVAAARNGTFDSAQATKGTIAAIVALGSNRGASAEPKRDRKLDGAEFVFGAVTTVEAIWGRSGSEVLWAPGEALEIVGPDGVGKSAIMQQLVLARCGLRSSLLGLPVAPANERLLYLAMDRPPQIARSLRRMVTLEDEETLRNRLSVWPGPLPIDVLSWPAALADWIEREFPGTSDVYIDSLKDLAPKLSEDEVGSKINLSRQELLARGHEVVEAHHQRKEQRGERKPRKLADVYGSRWLTAGAGSVILLWGDPGDLVVEFVHLKQPAEEVGPLRVVHDHVRGVSSVHEQVDLETLLAEAPCGLTVKDAGCLVFETSEPKANEIEKARRKLERLVVQGRAERRDEPGGLARYFFREAGV